MSRRVDLETLKHRPWLKTGQAARLYGHGIEYWVDLADRGVVRSKREGKRGDRYLLHGEYDGMMDAYTPGSIRAHMNAPSTVTLAARRQQTRTQRETMQEFRRRMKAAYQQAS